MPETDQGKAGAVGGAATGCVRGADCCGGLRTNVSAGARGELRDMGAVDSLAALGSRDDAVRMGMTCEGRVRMAAGGARPPGRAAEVG